MPFREQKKNVKTITKRQQIFQINEKNRLTDFLSCQKPLFDISGIRHLTFDPKLTPPLTLVNVGLKREKKLINYSWFLA